MKNASDQLFEKRLPAALEAEKLVLGSVLVGHPIENITTALKPADFSLEKHRRIFTAMAHLETSGDHVDRVTVAQELTRRGHIDSVDGHAYLISLDEGLPQLANLDSYVSIIRDKAVLRQAIAAHRAGIEECLAAADPTREIVERAERAIAGLATEIHSASFRTPMEVINRAGGITAFVSTDTRCGVETPWPLLNRMLVGRGFMPGQMVVIGSRPSMGKTALACQIADRAATHGTGVAFFTLEMPDQAILLRMAAARSKVDALKVSQGHASQQEILDLSEAFSDLADRDGCRLWIDDTPGCTVPAMRAALRRLMANHPIGLVVIDYLQLVETSGGSERRYEQVSERVASNV